jgi:hypothetical protein
VYDDVGKNGLCEDWQEIYIDDADLPPEWLTPKPSPFQPEKIEPAAQMPLL